MSPKCNKEKDHQRKMLSFSFSSGTTLGNLCLLPFTVHSTVVAAFTKMNAQNLFAGPFQVPEQFSKAAYYVTFDCVTGTG